VAPGGALRDRERGGLGVIPDGVALSVAPRAVQTHYALKAVGVWNDCTASQGRVPHTEQHGLVATHI
jgi:hypothetical protein